MDQMSFALVGLVTGALVAWLTVNARYAARLAAASAERDLLRERVIDLQTARSADSETAQLIGPLRESLVRVERQVHELERDRGEQFSVVASELARVQSSTQGLRDQTASLVGSLSSSSVRGTWGEVQLRRVLEHAGMLSRCDFDTQVGARNDHGASVRPDVVVHLPGGKHVVIDSKAPMTEFLAAQAQGIGDAERDQRLRAHAKALRGHVDALAERSYWTAVDATPEMVVCFVPGEGILGAALAADPELHEHAMRRNVVLASPGNPAGAAAHRGLHLAPGGAHRGRARAARPRPGALRPAGRAGTAYREARRDPAPLGRGVQRARGRRSRAECS